ncbi:probable arabinosyltransferase ARAD1 [Tanacetum coccineum]
MLEAVADQRLWIWHAFFEVPGANNNLNVLYGSPLFDDELADTTLECPFVQMWCRSVSGAVLHFADVAALFETAPGERHHCS